MAGRPRRNLPAPPEIAPPAADPTGMFEAFVRRLERIGNNNNRNNNQNVNAAPQRQTGDKLLERFRALRPEKFDGMAEPWQAEQWLREMDHIFETVECNDTEKRRLATFQLTYAAADWWEAEQATIGEEATRMMLWATFRELFLKKYFPEKEKDEKEKEFMELT